MKKPKASTRTAKAKRSPEDVQKYLAKIPKGARSTFAKLRATIRSAVPRGSTEVVSYKILAFENEGVLVWFGAFPKHCSLFPTGSVIEAFEKELERYSTSKGTIRFSIDEPLPTALIKKIVKARVAEKASQKKR
jgi:uncharacterized protein YdhG (YjbR/CyaY superfamily)